MAEAFKMKSVVAEEKEDQLRRPVNFHQRTEHVLKNSCSKVSDMLKKIEDHANSNEMVINKKKTKVMLFNTSTKYDCQPRLQIKDEVIEVVNKMKLLGVIISEDLRWHENTNFITNKALSRIWILRRLKNMGASRRMLIDTFYKQIRTVVEFGAVVWNAGLTLENIAQIERVQKSALCVILGSNYRSYEDSCEELEMKTLAERRKDLCIKFAKKASNHPVHQAWFIRNPTDNTTRTKKPTFKPACARTDRFRKSAIPYLTNLLNELV